MMLSRCQPAVPLFFLFFFLFFYKEDNNADSFRPAGERKGGPGQRRTERTRVEKKKGWWVGELWDNVAHQWAKRGEGLLSRRTESCWQNHKFHKAERSSGGLCVSWSAVVAGEESVWRCFPCPARSLSNSKRTGRVCVPVLVYGCSGLQWCLCVYVSATTKRLEIYWGDGLWGAMLVHCPSLPSQWPPPSSFHGRSQVSSPLSSLLSAAVKKPTQEMWIIQLWLLEICSGLGPGASRPAQMSPSKVNVVLVPSSVSARWEGRKCGSGGLEQVAVESEQDVVLLYDGRRSRWRMWCRPVGVWSKWDLCLMCAGLGWRAGAVRHSLGRGVSVGPRTSGPAHVYWTEPGCPLGKVRHSNTLSISFVVHKA